MAMTAWRQARLLAPERDPHQLVGVGATASLTSDRPKQGDHRIHVAVQTATRTTWSSLTLAKGARSRSGEEQLASELVLLGLASACSLDTQPAQLAIQGQLQADEPLASERQEALTSWTELLLGQRGYVSNDPALEPRVIFPGAFSPPHAGHWQMATIAAQRTGRPVALELSITNVDKRPLDFRDIQERLAGLTDRPVLLTNAPTFRAKSALFPGCTFVVGSDTIARVGNPRYYTGEAGSFEMAIKQLTERGCRFLVFGRLLDGRFRTLSDLQLPAALGALCEEVGADAFREDLSSTQLRNPPAPT
jgi:hypothetical protein